MSRHGIMVLAPGSAVKDRDPRDHGPCPRPPRAGCRERAIGLDGLLGHNDGTRAFLPTSAPTRQRRRTRRPPPRHGKHRRLSAPSRATCPRKRASSAMSRIEPPGEKRPLAPGLGAAGPRPPANALTHPSCRACDRGAASRASRPACRVVWAGRVRAAADRASHIAASRFTPSTRRRSRMRSPLSSAPVRGRPARGDPAASPWYAGACARGGSAARGPARHRRARWRRCGSRRWVRRWRGDGGQGRVAGCRGPPARGAPLRGGWNARTSPPGGRAWLELGLVAEDVGVFGATPVRRDPAERRERSWVTTVRTYSPPPARHRRSLGMAWSRWVEPRGRGSG